MTDADREAARPEAWRSVGMFEYHEALNGWGDTFRIVDDDGMPFVLDDLKRFNGRGVTITIEFAPDFDHQANSPCHDRRPDLYHRIGLTREAYGQVRKRMMKP